MDVPTPHSAQLPPLPPQARGAGRTRPSLCEPSGKRVKTSPGSQADTIVRSLSPIPVSASQLGSLNDLAEAAALAEWVEAGETTKMLEPFPLLTDHESIEQLQQQRDALTAKLEALDPNKNEYLNKTLDALFEKGKEYLEFLQDRQIASTALQSALLHAHVTIRPSPDSVPAQMKRIFQIILLDELKRLPDMGNALSQAITRLLHPLKDDIGTRTVQLEGKEKLEFYQQAYALSRTTILPQKIRLLYANEALKGFLLPGLTHAVKLSRQTSFIDGTLDTLLEHEAIDQDLLPLDQRQHLLLCFLKAHVRSHWEINIEQRKQIQRELFAFAHNDYLAPLPLFETMTKLLQHITAHNGKYRRKLLDNEGKGECMEAHNALEAITALSPSVQAAKTKLQQEMKRYRN